MPMLVESAPPTGLPEPAAGANLPFALSVAAGMSRTPRRLECRFLYDARGSALYEEITRQPEYYLTRTEAAILQDAADDIAAIAGAATIVELGSGSSVKTSHLLSACSARAPLRYYPVDVSESALREAAARLGTQHPGVEVRPLCMSYEETLPLISRLSPLLLLFLGSTIGNFDEMESHDFFSAVSAALAPGDFFLLGVDLVKEPLLLERAYNDAAGVTSQFTLNIFSRMNRELGAGIDLDAVSHVARYVPSRSRIEIFGRFSKDQTVRIPRLGAEYQVKAGEEILVEVSRKFMLEELVPYLDRFGLVARKVYTDPRKWFGLLLLQRTGLAGRPQ